jgi:hypothetical protein
MMLRSAALVERGVGRQELPPTLGIITVDTVGLKAMADTNLLYTMRKTSTPGFCLSNSSAIREACKWGRRNNTAILFSCTWALAECF